MQPHLPLHWFRALQLAVGEERSARRAVGAEWRRGEHRAGWSTGRPTVGVSGALRPRVAVVLWGCGALRLDDLQALHAAVNVGVGARGGAPSVTVMYPVLVLDARLFPFAASGERCNEVSALRAQRILDAAARLQAAWADAIDGASLCVWHGVRTEDVLQHCVEQVLREHGRIDSVAIAWSADDSRTVLERVVRRVHQLAEEADVPEAQVLYEDALTEIGEAPTRALSSFAAFCAYAKRTGAPLQPNNARPEGMMAGSWSPREDDLNASTEGIHPGTVDPLPSMEALGYDRQAARWARHAASAGVHPDARSEGQLAQRLAGAEFCIGRLAPHLSNGCLSPRQLWATVGALRCRRAVRERLQTELLWNEYWRLLKQQPAPTT